MIHYSGQAARARIAGTVGREEAFQAFLGSVSLADVVAMAEDAFVAAGVPEDMRDEELAKLRRSQLTRSRQQLIFIYKEAFEQIAKRGRGQFFEPPAPPVSTWPTNDPPIPGRRDS